MAPRLIIGIPFAGLLFGGAADRRHHQGEPVYDREILVSGRSSRKATLIDLVPGFKRAMPVFPIHATTAGPA
jgi:hypothetical protein